MATAKEVYRYHPNAEEIGDVLLPGPGPGVESAAWLPDD
jgi:hypothetical protein